MNHKYAQVLVNIKGLGVKTYSYIIPDQIKDKIQIGQAVLVPFGKRVSNAFIVGFTDYLEEGIYAKKIIKIIDETPLFSLDYLKLLEWVANYYITDFVTVLNMVIPLKLLEKSSKTIELIEFKKYDGATKRQTEILKVLDGLGKVSLIDFEKQVKTTRATIKKLATLGCVEITEEEVYRNPLQIFEQKTEPLFELSGEQKEVYEQISAQIKSGNRTPMLLYGVTASGKTEVYFKLIKDTIDRGQNVLFLAPEIALASQLSKRLTKKFGIKDVAIWHSSISEGERYDVWQRLYKDDIKILAGARSAVFAPLKNIGLIILDEEHESAYKQTNPAPRYDTRVVAQKLAEFHNAPILLGSATPDIVSYFKAKSKNTLFSLPHRFNNAPMATTHVVDMQVHGKPAYKKTISKILESEIQDRLEKQQQVIILINRRGYSTTTQCLSCGTVLECPNCAIPLVWHNDNQKLKCHYCGEEMEFPEKCPECGADTIKNSGVGIQKIEIFIKEMFPNARVARLDSDILSKKNEHIRLLEKFQNKEIDILVGTQMVAKGLDNENVTLVGVINADSSFSLPDFRAPERGFQLLTQVAGRVGRGKYKGKVLFQSYNPDFYALENAKDQNYLEFYDTEIKAREEFDYPPYSQIIRLILSADNEFRTERSALEIAYRLRTMVDKFGIKEHLEVLGPTECIISKINNKYRHQIIIKNKIGERGHMFMTKFINQIKMPKDIRLAIDVDPLDIL